MSRLGIKPVEIAEGTSVELSPTRVTVRGTKGQIEVTVPYGITVKQNDKEINVSRQSDSKQNRALHGTVRNLIKNAIEGVSKGFEKRLELVGIGYRAAVEARDLVLQVGFTHPVRLSIPDGLEVAVEKNVLVIKGANKEHLGQFCAEVRAVRPPEPYKGKGIRYQGEVIRMKQGKAMKAAGA